MVITNNWTSEATIKQLKDNATKVAKKKRILDREKENEGLTRIYVPHPTVPNCKVERWVKL